MKTCPFCNAPMEDNAKFCTNCGQKIVSPAAPTIYETPMAPTISESPAASTPLQQGTGMTYAQQPTNPQDGFVPEGAGNGYAQQPTNQQGSFVPQGGSNGYGQLSAQQGASGYGQPGMSGSAMQHGPIPQGGMPNGGITHGIPQGMPQPDMAQNPKKKPVLPFIIIGVVALIAVITVVVLFLTGILGGGNNSADDKNLGEWKAVSLVKDGQTLDPKDYLDGEMVIVLNKGGKASVVSGSDKASATWTLNGDKFTIKGGGLDETGTLKDGILKLTNMGGSGADWIFTKDGKPVSGQSGNQTGNDATDKNSGGWTHDDGPDSNAADYDDTDSVQTPFQYFAGEYRFSSGAGGWETEVTIHPDGSFTGLYYDFDMGDYDEEKYPNGTVYRCRFSGTFSELIKKDDFTYTCILETITQENESGMEEMDSKEGQRVIYADPYGFDDAKEFEFYLPGKSVTDCDPDFLMWLSLQYGEPYPDTLPYKAFNNMSNMYGFRENVDESKQVTATYPKSLSPLIFEIAGSYTNKKLGITMNISTIFSGDEAYQEGIEDAWAKISWDIPEDYPIYTLVNNDAYVISSDNGFDAKAWIDSYKIIVTDATEGKIVIHLYDETGYDCGEYVMTKREVVIGDAAGFYASDDGFTMQFDQYGRFSLAVPDGNATEGFLSSNPGGCTMYAKEYSEFSSPYPVSVGFVTFMDESRISVYTDVYGEKEFYKRSSN